MKTTRTIKDSAGKTLTVSASGQLLRGGLTAGESHLVLMQIRGTGGADLDELKETGISGRKLSVYLRYLEKHGQAFFCYATNAWKSCEPRDEHGCLISGGRAS